MTGLHDMDHLKKWLAETDRAWLVFKSADLVDALSPLLGQDGEPVALQSLQQIIAAYAAHRATQVADTAVHEVVAPDGTKTSVTESTYKDERLTIEELDRAIRALVRQMFDRDPNWSLENAPL